MCIRDSYGQGGDVRAYPLQVLMWHELVNDRFREHPVTVSYCPLCNTAIAYDGRVGDRELRLRNDWKTSLQQYADVRQTDRVLVAAGRRESGRG